MSRIPRGAWGLFGVGLWGVHMGITQGLLVALLVLAWRSNGYWAGGRVGGKSD